MKTALFSCFVFISLFLITSCRAGNNQGLQDSPPAQGALSVSEVEHAAAPVVGSSQEFSLPSIVDLFQFNNDYSNPFMEDFRIWGWSRDGRVAHSAAGHDGGITTLYFNIVDYFSADSRSVSYWENFDDFNVDDDGNHLDIDGRIIDFNEIYQNFYNVCIENGIEFMQSEYRRLPIAHNNRTHNVIMDLTKQYTDGIDVVESYSVIAESQGERFTHTAQEGYAYDVFLLGYFINPFENRVLLAIGKSIFGGYISDFFLGLDLDTGFIPAAGTSSQSEEDRISVVSIDYAPERFSGDYHFFADEQTGDSIILYTTENLENFAYIELLPSVDPEGNFAFLIGEVLFGIDDFTPEKPFIITAHIGSGIPARGIVFWHRGSERSFFITESGMDGSLQLIEFIPFYG